jgi:alpha-D-xyloside xylohydrolase
MSSHSRLHGSSSYRVPWNYDDDACAVLRFFTKLKCRLMPYLYAAAVEAHREGIPMMRPMPLEFPDDPACDTLDRQYMLGGSLLVAPVFSEDGWVDYYLPEGRWTHLISGEVQDGGRWRRAQHGFMSLPLFVRAGAVLAVGAVDARPDYEYAEGVNFQIYELADGAEAVCSVPDQKGAERLRLSVRRAGDRYDATVVGDAIPNWSLEVASGSPSALVGDVGAPRAPARSIQLKPGTREARLITKM